MMFQLAIVSGKGGTGKTTLSGSLSVLFDSIVMADCDVDAPNLHLILENKLIEKYEYFGGKKAEISDSCISCGICEKYCRFDAVIRGGPYSVDPYACEGCGMCVAVCPADAITLKDNKSGDYFLSQSNGIPLVHALLTPGEETSGGLVAEVRKLAIKVAEEEKKEVIIIDGAPGIGCPATSSITGTTYVLVVAEPTVSGNHDLARIVETIRHFKRDFGIVINKWDLNTSKSSFIESWCGANGIELIGKIPFDEQVEKATIMGKPVVSIKGSEAAEAIVRIAQRLKRKISGVGG
ncbi:MULTISPECIES: ATP-binding protein [Mesotoga]|jgi:MinD superfamily P-loop ATPase|uniref:nucleotide-binding protein n=3 Tax=Kosmotogaceae TaxID=1643948 RepID=UPI0002CAB883|nr:MULTISPECIES: ATP-binding protein [Mesotoga]CCU86003.1 Cobyrinic acid ac-diamide synthase [Mesotoga infera]HNQ70009.1 4Fe-4S binding protein [Mesotoga prima]HOP37048.1 4Fe-4S binding protein [Mesotoga prima]HOZ98908.1 4Fe-4S binding protein [Mesotoga prima]HPE52815.1 4Fe-4S binding protein [Mesotoga prima]